jgi:hypothetical protein
MHILKKEEYDLSLNYDPESGSLTWIDTGDSAVEYRRHNHAVVVVEVNGEREEHPAAIIAWIMSGNRWSYSQMIVSINRDLGDISLANLKSVPKGEYEAERAPGSLVTQIKEAISLCTLGLSGTLESKMCLELIKGTLEKARLRR